MDAEGTGDRQQGQDLASVELGDLLQEVLSRVHGSLDEQTRLRLLVDAVVTMAADLDLQSVLERIVVIAGQLVDAQYAALGVLETGSRRGLRTFVHHGMAEEVVEQIGELPTGHGILGLLIDRPEPLRLHEINAHPASYGFPEHHPPMSSFLGVPVRTRGKVFGNLYLTEKAGGSDFTPEDESIVLALAAAAGVVIENARLYEEAAQRQSWLAATAEITAVLAGEVPRSGALQMIADLARNVSGADVVWLVIGHDPQSLRLQTASGVRVDFEVTRSVPLERSLAATVVETGRPMVSEDIGTDPAAFDMAGLPDWPRLGPAVVVPLRSGHAVEGALGLAWTHERASGFDALDPALPSSFAEHAALALQIVQSREDRERLALLEDRDRIGRELHDVVIQRLFAMGLSLQGASRTRDHETLVGRVDQAVDDLDATIKDIRRSIFGLAMTDASHDIQAEVTRLVDRAAATLKFRPTLSFEGPVRTVVSGDLAPEVLAVLAEALSNASRHALARAVDVAVKAGDDVVLRVRDDGRGMPDDVIESGLRNMRERAERRGGRLLIETKAGEGTMLEWCVPAGNR